MFQLLIFLVTQCTNSKLILNETYTLTNLQNNYVLNLKKTYLFELRILQFPSQENSFPYIAVKNASETWYDKTRFSQRSSYQQIYVENQTQVDIVVYTKIMNGIPTTNDGNIMKFTLTIIEDPQPKQICYFPNYGLECDQTIIQSTLESNLILNVKNLSWIYTYFQLQNDDYQLQVDNENQKFGLALLAINKTEETVLPSFIYLFQVVYENQSLTVNLNKVNDVDNYIFEIGVYNFNNTHEQTIKLKLNQLKSESEFPPWIIILIIVIVLIGLLIIILIVRSILRHEAQQQQLQPKRALEIKMMNKYMPIKKMADLHLNENSTCCICLIQFTREDKIRMTPCSHHFHSECLQDWTVKQANCPICRQQLTDEELIKYLQVKRNRKIHPLKINQQDKSTVQLTKHVSVQQTPVISQPYIPDLRNTQNQQDQFDNSPQNCKSMERVLGDQIIEDL